MLKFADGAFCFFKVRSHFQPMAPDALQGIAQKHAIPPSIIPKYAGDRAIVARARDATQAKVSKAGWLLRKIIAEKEHVVYGIVQEEKNQEAQTLQFSHDASCEWAVATDGGIAIHGTHEIALLVDATYQSLKGLIAGADWTESIVEYITGTCMATPVRPEGRIWWCPPSTLDKLTALTAFLDEIGIGLVLCSIEPEAKVVIEESVTDSMESQIQALQDEVEAFDGSERMKTYTERLAQYQELRKRAIMYRDVLGLGIQDAEAALNDLEAKVGSMMLVKEATKTVKAHAAAHVGEPESLGAEEVAF